jgi:multisite-specific tRNA:(cytosine-C5)-methyltransferase
VRKPSAYQDIPKTNEKLERYYNEPGIIPEEDQEEFWTTMRRDLPNSFRFTGSRGYASFTTPSARG